MTLRVGASFGPYDVVALEGRGGTAEVYRARDTRLNRHVVLNHPNIAAIHGIEEHDGIQALVLELVEGPTLADRIAQGPLPLEQTLRVARQVAAALDAAHEHGIVHRDVKPSNIKLRADGTVKVLDFGLATAVDPRASGADHEASTATAPLRNTRERLTRDPVGALFPVWMPDNRSIVYASAKGGPFDLYTQSTSADADARALHQATMPGIKYPTDVTRDGGHVVFQSDAQMFRLSLAGDRQVSPLPRGMQGRVSPNGRLAGLHLHRDSRPTGVCDEVSGSDRAMACLDQQRRGSPVARRQRRAVLHRRWRHADGSARPARPRFQDRDGSSTVSRILRASSHGRRPHLRSVRRRAAVPRAGIGCRQGDPAPGHDELVAGR